MFYVKIGGFCGTPRPGRGLTITPTNSYCYNGNMSKDVTFSLDTDAAAKILTDMALPTITQRGEAIAARAQSIASSISSDPPEITVSTTVGTIRKGTRAIATVRANGRDAHQNYVGYTALTKSKDAGRT